MAEIVSYDPIKKSRTLYYGGNGGEEFTLRTEQDVSDIIEFNKAQYNATDERARWGDAQVVARIPMEMYFQWLRDKVIDPDGYPTDDSDKQLLKMLQDPSFKDLRTRPGRLA